MRIRKLLDDQGHIEPITVRPGCSLVETAQLLSEKKIGALPVVDDAGAMVGIVSERDLVRGLAQHGPAILSRTAGDVMTSPVITCGEDEEAEPVYRKMIDKQIRHMPVVRNGALAGILSIRDFEAAYRYLLDNSAMDDITGMANPRFFARFLEAEFNRFRRFHFPLSVVVARISDYGPFARQNGDAAGERLLRGLAEAFAEETRSFDIIGHICEDEFAIILPNTEAKAACRACDRLLAAAQAFFSRERAGLSLGIGLAYADTETRDANSILGHARMLAARAEKGGGNRYEAGNTGATPQPGAGLVAAE